MSSWASPVPRNSRSIASVIGFSFRLTDSLILLMVLRFVGVSSGEVKAAVVLATFFVAYPLTLTPLMGLGLFDAVLLAAFLEVGGDAIETGVVAALAVWRVQSAAGAS